MFTWFPMIWASGAQVMNPEAPIAAEAAPRPSRSTPPTTTCQHAGAVGDGAKEETGATWVAGFQRGQGRRHALSGDAAGHRDQTFDVGVRRCPASRAASRPSSAATGSASRRIPSPPTQAWNFLVWLTSEDAQVGVLAKGGDVVSRSDLANNEYSEKDPRVVTVNQVAAKGETPISVNFQQAFNATDSPWLTLIRNAIWGSAAPSIPTTTRSRRSCPSNQRTCCPAPRVDHRVHPAARTPRRPQ